MLDIKKLVGLTQCAVCDDLIHVDEKLDITFTIDGQVRKQDHVCGQLCAEVWNLQQLREAGL